GLLITLLLSSTLWADDLQTPTPDTSLTISSTPTPQPTPDKPEYTDHPDPSKALVLHKPKPSPAWGKVIQYHQEKVMALSDKDNETLHEFLFQDDNGIIRTAIFHENASGDGYWEVWVWDQP
ncbi:MAG TPA: hypothetical protein VK859_08125, partial [bacterium]|nr:hypothetical protein [bacterium]